LGAVTTIVHPSVVPGMESFTARGWDFAWRRFAVGLEITWLERGGSDWRLGRWSGTRTPGSVSVVPPGQLAVGTKVHAPGDFFHLQVSPALLDGMAKATIGAPLAGADAAVRASRLAHLVREGAPALAIELALVSLLERVHRFESTRENVGTRRAAHRMRDLLHARFSDTLTLAELADAAGISRFHGARAFRREFGVPPFEYLMHVRLTRAAEALRAGGRPVEVAAQTGFADQPHLTRWFARMFRITPAAFAGPRH
jgi:AraC-like DNA-binding protein